MHTRRRTVHFYDLIAKASTRSDVESPSSAGIAALLDSFTRLKGGLPFDIQHNNKVVTSLVDWRYDASTNCYALLLNKADAELSDVALRDLGSRRMRKANKQKHEGIERSSHILIRPNQDGQSALMLMTMGADISHETVSKALRLLSKEACKQPDNQDLFRFQHPSASVDERGNPHLYRVSYTFPCYGHKSQTLEEALRTGTFESMELIEHHHENFDGGGNLNVSQRSITVKASGGPVTAAGLFNSIRRHMGAHADTPYDTARVHYKSQTGKLSTASLAINNLDAAFTRNESIHFDTDVEAQQNTLSDTVLNAMKPLLQSLSSQ